MQWKIIFQLLFTGFVLLGAFYYVEMSFLSNILDVSEKFCNENTNEVCDKLLSFQSSFDKLFLTKSIFIIFCLTIWGLFFSHKVAGPIHRIIKTLTSLRDGQNPKKLSLRRGDFLHEVACLVNDLIDAKKQPRKE